MLSWVGVAATLFSAPVPDRVAAELSGDVLPWGSAVVIRTAVSPLADGTGAPEALSEARFWSWIGHLAVLRPGPANGRAPPSVKMFVVVAPVEKGVGIRAIGSF